MTRISLGTGSAADKRQSELIEHYGFGVAIQTKSNRILRDLDLLKRINARTKSGGPDHTDDS